MEIERILSELQQNRGYFPREAVEEAIRRREEITPHILRVLQKAAGHTPESKEMQTSFLPLYAMFLLAQFRDRSAYPLIIGLCKLPRDVLDNLLGDTIRMYPGPNRQRESVRLQDFMTLLSLCDPNQRSGGTPRVHAVAGRSTRSVANNRLERQSLRAPKRRR